MRILITNDDGIQAPGLAVLEAIAAEIAGPSGEVWTVAPAFEKSGVSHCINYTHPTLISRFGPRRFAVEGAPADCVLAGIYDVLGGEAPDLVLSGVNRGNNSGENTMYSGTIGAAIEGALQGCRSIALSQYYGPENRDLEDAFEASLVHGADVVRKILDHGAWGDGATYGTFYNVNFPPVPTTDVKGVKAAAQGRRPDTRFSVEALNSPSGRRFLWAKGGRQDVTSAPGTDVAVNLDGWISVTPMRCDLTAHDALAALGQALEG